MNSRPPGDFFVSSSNIFVMPVSSICDVRPDDPMLSYWIVLFVVRELIYTNQLVWICLTYQIKLNAGRNGCILDNWLLTQYSQIVGHMVMPLVVCAFI